MAKKTGILSSQLYVVSSFGDVTMGGGISRHRVEGKITQRTTKVDPVIALRYE